MTKPLGQNYKDFMDKAREISEVQEYLESFSVSIGNMVFARRMQLNLTQQQLADLAGTTQKRISLIETASGNVEQKTLDNVFRALKLKSLNASFEEMSATVQG